MYYSGHCLWEKLNQRERTVRPSAAEVIETSTSNNSSLREFEPDPDLIETCALMEKPYASEKIVVIDESKVFDL